MTKKINLIIGSTREGRVAKSIADWLVTTAHDSGIELGILDLKEINLPFFEGPSPAYFPPSTEEAKSWQAKIVESEALVILTAEYNRGIPAPLKNAIDYLYADWNDKPVHIVSYGYIDGGASATKHLLDVLGWVKTKIVADPQAISLTQDTFDESGKFKDVEASLGGYKGAFITALKAL
jgi:NAD(P)H-dependent FMN reductase